MVFVGAEVSSVGRDELDRENAVRGQAVLADHPAEAAAERVAEDADVGRRARQIAETVLARGLGQGLAEDARLDARALRLRVDLDSRHPLGLQQQGVRAPVDRARVVAAPVERDPETVLGGEDDGRDDVLGGLRQNDRDRLLCNGQVPRLARRVPAVVAGQDDIAGEVVPEPTQVDSGGFGLHPYAS